MPVWLSAVAVAVVVLLIGGLWWHRHTSKTVISTTPQSPGKHFHGVSIRPTSGACRAVQAIAGKRYFPNEAPNLPLRDCDVSYCGCRYEHHQDRRTQIDRRHVHVDIVTQRSGKEHREHSDRRQGRR